MREVAAINKMQTQEQELRSFLFGADRIGLHKVDDGLRDMGVADCFWCERSLGNSVVDHVIPWSHYPNDGSSSTLFWPTVSATTTSRGSTRHG